MSRSLEGILVVALDQAVAAPFVASRLADAGARVLKVERKGGDFAREYDSVVDGESAYFVWLNRGKESIELDIKSEEDNALLHRMIARADVFIQNLAPGAAARAGFSSAELRRQFPKLITCDISGYGETGPYSKMKAYDLLVQAETGLSSVTGGPESPGRVGVSVCDIGTGMYAQTAILEALFERERTGKGKGIKVSLFDSMADWMTVPLLHQEGTGIAPKRMGLNHPSISPYGAYSCKDGTVVISIQSQREWKSFCEIALANSSLTDDPRFATNELRQKNRSELDREISRVFETLTLTQLIQRLSDANIAYGALNSVEAFSKHPQLRRIELTTPSGRVSMVAPPAQFVGEQSGFGGVPKLGEHNESLRKEFAA